MDEYKFPELAEKDFAPHAGDEVCIGYETVLEFDEQRNPIGVHYDPIFVVVEDDYGLQTPLR